MYVILGGWKQFANDVGCVILSLSTCCVVANAEVIMNTIIGKYQREDISTGSTIYFENARRCELYYVFIGTNESCL